MAQQLHMSVRAYMVLSRSVLKLRRKQRCFIRAPAVELGRCTFHPPGARRLDNCKSSHPQTSNKHDFHKHVSIGSQACCAAPVGDDGGKRCARRINQGVALARSVLAKGIEGANVCFRCLQAHLLLLPGGRSRVERKVHVVYSTDFKRL